MGVKMSVALLKSGTSPTRAMLLDNLHTSDYPAAIGYFVLEAIKEMGWDEGKMPEVNLKVGVIDSELLRNMDVARAGRLDGANQPYVPRAHDTEFGEVYRATRAVEYGDRSIFES